MSDKKIILIAIGIAIVFGLILNLIMYIRY
jgi:hypothetical protein